MNLHSIRFLSVFLRFCFSLKKYALFRPHFYKSISALSRLLHINKNFVQKFCVWTIRAKFQNKAVFLCKKFFSDNFCPVCDSLVSADMGIQNANEKEHTCSRRSKNVKKRIKTNKKRILRKFTCSLPYCDTVRLTNHIDVKKVLQSLVILFNKIPGAVVD